MKMATRGSDRAPVFAGGGASFLDFEQQVRLRMRTTKTEVAARASLLALQLRPAPRQVCLAAGGNISGHQDGATRILDIRRSYFAPEAAHAIRQQVTRFTNYRRSGQSVDECIAEFDLLRRRPESEMVSRTIRPDPAHGYCGVAPKGGVIRNGGQP